MHAHTYSLSGIVALTTGAVMECPGKRVFYAIKMLCLKKL
jgi:hypothetical protein